LKKLFQKVFGQIRIGLMPSATDFRFYVGDNTNIGKNPF